MADVIQIRRDTAENWTKANPILAQGEFGFETDTLKLKVGDGITTWVSLRYYRSEDSYTAGDGISIQDFVVSNTGVRSLATGSTNGTIKVNGTTDVSVKGLGSAAYTASNAYATAAQGTKADNAADKNLSNLTSTGANIGNWSHNVSNCITEIPQDVKLELNAGTLTLKAGSKVYVPNGSGSFTTTTVASDITVGSPYTNAPIFLYYYNGGIQQAAANAQQSGSSYTITSGYWYDTTNNYIKRITSGSVAFSGVSFPIGVVSATDGSWSNIDQVFDGFGYIGSHVFALPGLSVLTPNGRNVDGTLANRKYTFTTCTIFTRNISSSNVPLWVRYNGTIGLSTGITYDPITNKSIGADGYAQIGMVDLASGVISNFRLKQAFHILDYNDTDFIAKQSTPSNRYIELTLPASNQGVVAPGNGYITLVREAAQSWSSITLQNSTNGLRVSSVASSAGTYFAVTLPVSTGDSVLCQYTSNDTTVRFRFVYANGAK